MIYTNFSHLFSLICEIKQNVLKLNGKELRNYKKVFYNQKFPVWQLNLLWEYIFDDISYEELRTIFERSNVI